MLMLAALVILTQSETATAQHEIFLSKKYRTGNAFLEGRSAVCRKDEGKGRDSKMNNEKDRQEKRWQKKAFCLNALIPKFLFHFSIL